MKKHYDIIIRGRVQNVGFRFYAQRTAQALNIIGFVKNRHDGSVYIEAEGEEENLQHFIAWCRQGPSWAAVIEVLVNAAPLKNFNGFLVQ
ncbi:MAG: acylphosphatase [Bacteroidales bacterium]|nr:acylphosphatase [Bacteroidales bacterium]MDZ4205236.1 acylphosphatase [Bacteroidales bacterium]